MTKWIKRIAVAFVAAFVLFYLFTRPEAAAEAVRTFFALFGAAVDSLVAFFTALVS